MRLHFHLAFFAVACAANPPATQSAPAPVPDSGSGSVSKSGSDSESVSESVSVSEPASESTKPTGPARPFPPPDIPPPHPRSAEPNDGRWTHFHPPWGDPNAPVEPRPTFATTVIHPHEASRFITVTLVAIDLVQASIHFMPGTEDLGGQKAPFAAGLVPESERERLLAVFNGGFQPRHGRWGMKLGDTTVMPPRDEGCTLALYADGSVRLRSWPAIAATAAEMRAIRQTPPCLVEEGAVHPDLLAGRDKAWKGNTAGIVTRRRSAVGLDESGSVLFYALGIEASPRLLAEALRTAGAKNAAELDINWAWTRFFLYGRDPAGKLAVTTSLAPGEYSKFSYVERASERDFFYVLRR